MKKWININELNRIIAKHFGKKFCSSVEAEIGSIGEQYNSKKFILGGGSILTIQFELSEEPTPQR